MYRFCSIYTLMVVMMIIIISESVTGYESTKLSLCIDANGHKEVILAQTHKPILGT